MKQLFLIRHAKSSWEDWSLPDADRPLNDRGRRDAPDMAGRLLASNIQIDQFVASPAKRARKTALLFMDVFQQKKKDLLLVPDLYMASPSTFAQVIAGFDDRYNSVALFSHNPGITDFANTLTEVRLDNMPTCSVFAVSVAADHWTDFATAAKSFVFFDFPKSAKGQV